MEGLIMFASGSNTIRAFEIGGVKLEKGLADFSCGELNGRHSEF